MINEIKRIQQLAGIQLNELSINIPVKVKWVEPDDSNNYNEIKLIYNKISIGETDDEYQIGLWIANDSNENILGISIWANEPSYGGGFDDINDVNAAYDYYDRKIEKLNQFFKDLNKSDNITCVNISKNDIVNWSSFINKMK